MADTFEEGVPLYLECAATFDVLKRVWSFVIKQLRLTKFTIWVTDFAKYTHDTIRIP